jgi:hypothetical protein
LTVSPEEPFETPASEPEWRRSVLAELCDEMVRLFPERFRARARGSIWPSRQRALTDARGEARAGLAVIPATGGASSVGRSGINQSESGCCGSAVRCGLKALWRAASGSGGDRAT